MKKEVDQNEVVGILTKLKKKESITIVEIKNLVIYVERDSEYLLNKIGFDNMAYLSMVIFELESSLLFSRLLNEKGISTEQLQNVYNIYEELKFIIQKG